MKSKVSTSVISDSKNTKQNSPKKLKLKPKTKKEAVQPKALEVTLGAEFKNDTRSISVEKSLSGDVKGLAQATPIEMYIGGHTSISGGAWKAVEEAAAIKAKAFGLFLRNQKQWKVKPLIEGHPERFRETCKTLGFSPQYIVPHGSYLMNCGSFKDEIREKSHAMLIEELQRCEALGLLYFNFHPGSTLGQMPVPQCLAYIADAINKAHKATKYAVALLENMSCQGNTVGGKFEELRDIINLVENKSRIGVCIDTCHAHAAGYNLATAEGYSIMMEDLESIIGFEYVKAMHINDSKGPSGCHKDRHENIGQGTIGLDGFKRIVNDPRWSEIPMILETPFKSDDIYAKEIKLLYSLQA